MHNKLTILFPTLLLITLISCAMQENEKGWTKLFDGKTTAGWHKYGGGAVGSAWKVKDGELYLDTLAKADWKIKEGGDIVTDKEYENFHLKYDWKISKNGNSGVMFYVQDDSVKYKASYETGPEMQVLDNDGHPDGKIFKHHAGDLYDLIPCSTKTVKPVGEWNHAEIICDHGSLTFKLNGTAVVQTTMWDDAWKELIANSKFKQWPGFGAFKKGHICIQYHGNMVWYKEVMVKEL